MEGEIQSGKGRQTYYLSVFINPEAIWSNSQINIVTK